MEPSGPGLSDMGSGVAASPSTPLSIVALSPWASVAGLPRSSQRLACRYAPGAFPFKRSYFTALTIRSVPVEAGRRTAALIPGASLSIIPGMGHDIASGLIPVLVGGTSPRTDEKADGTSKRS